MKEIEEEISRLSHIVHEKTSAFDKKWFAKKRDSVMADFDEYQEKINKACQPELGQLIKLETKLRMEKEPVFSELPDYGDVMSLKDFIENVKCGGFIDYDGYGNYVKDGKETDIEIYPSDVKKGNIRKDFDTIIWFNR